MRRALALAKRGGRAVSPNPMVGCVLVKSGRIIAEGWHKFFGGPHAEAAALRRAGLRAKGSTAYVTLEPCSNHPGKKTPPCAPALIKAGVAEVVAAMRDPHPGVNGRGLRLLRGAGIKTRTGLGARQAKGLNKAFLTRMRRRRPYVLLKTALSLDGRAFAPGGRSRWITGRSARKIVHQWRAGSDAILVGIGTVLADNPSLTSHGAGKNPVRVVLDARLRTPRRAQVLSPEAPTWVFTASSRKLPGAQTIRVPAKAGRLRLKSVLSELARRGIATLLVEGGPTVHAGFLKEGLVDEARIFFAPKLIAGTADPSRAPRLRRPRLKRAGDDFLFYGKLS
ncbi:MAG: riboflavin biosynthesis protein RibD [Elusimicrobia bacterium RIFCSPHIGHO2_02_FULL_57_9]|nr:MAG: riboflavin biosynthesis protein RibD [Elusimicrobia bacterium RIFCSPHIGHO2_02_FULL_57_9]